MPKWEAGKKCNPNNPLRSIPRIPSTYAAKNTNTLMMSKFFVMVGILFILSVFINHLNRGKITKNIRYHARKTFLETKKHGNSHFFLFFF